MSDSIEIIKQGFLQVSSLHKIFYTTFGNPNGIPLLCFHGGPGGDFKLKYSALADQNKYYTILFSQRGCGKSIPLGELKENTPNDAVEDAEKLLEFLNIDKCCVMGFSYGSTLAMLFAIKNPDMVKSLFLSSVFLPDDFDNRFYGKKAEEKSPDEYEKFMSIIQCKTSAELFQKIINSDDATTKNIIRAFIDWEIQLFKGKDSVQYSYPDEIDQTLVFSKLTLLHYTANDYFGISNQILNNLDRLKNIPMTIVHGDSDYLTPISTAYELQKSLPQIKIIPVQNAGHVGSRVTQKLYEVINNYD